RPQRRLEPAEEVLLERVGRQDAQIHLEPIEPARRLPPAELPAHAIEERRDAVAVHPGDALGQRPGELRVLAAQLDLDPVDPVDHAPSPPSPASPPPSASPASPASPASRTARGSISSSRPLIALRARTRSTLPA